MWGRLGAGPVSSPPPHRATGSHPRGLNRGVCRTLVAEWAGLAVETQRRKLGAVDPTAWGYR